jgi:hypothetical protein
MKAMNEHQHGMSNGPETATQHQEDPAMVNNAGAVCHSLAGLEVGSVELSASEIEGLLYMIEEEKMAMDLYDAFADQSGSAIFDNISNSELRHMSALLEVAEAAGIDVSAAVLEAGVFNDPHIQETYDALLAQGSASTADAINVGIIVEETDIADLQLYDTGDEIGLLGVVYDNLLAASANHLDAFTQYSSAGA